MLKLLNAEGEENATSSKTCCSQVAVTSVQLHGVVDPCQTLLTRSPTAHWRFSAALEVSFSVLSELIPGVSNPTIGLHCLTCDANQSAISAPGH